MRIPLLDLLFWKFGRNLESNKVFLFSGKDWVLVKFGRLNVFFDLFERMTDKMSDRHDGEKDEAGLAKAENGFMRGRCVSEIFVSSLRETS